jgi:hypothetical protein
LKLVADFVDFDSVRHDTLGEYIASDSSTSPLVTITLCVVYHELPFAFVLPYWIYGLNRTVDAMMPTP